ncbi:MAG: polysaccharide biosynthesis/export family protein [Rikenellaceae bacterium]
MKKIIYFFAIILFFCSCNTQKRIIYLQDNTIETEMATIKGGEIRLKPTDMISIFVSSKNPELATIFNLSRVQQTIGSNSLSSGQSGTLAYTVGDDGTIDFPVLGKLNVEGKTRLELAAHIKQQILDSEYIKDPIVTVEFYNLTFSTLGEVSKVGTYDIKKDKTTIFEALSMSGDLTINGKRERVFLSRKLEDDKLITYQLNLKSKDIFQSPAYYVQQGDLIYVEPNSVKTNQSTVNGNSLKSTSFWMSLISFITSMTLIIN